MTGANPHILTGGSAPLEGGETDHAAPITSYILSYSDVEEPRFSFDWYQGTPPASYEAVRQGVLKHFPEGVQISKGTGRSGYKFSDDLWSEDGECLATIMHGGHNPHPSVKASGGDNVRRADVLASILRTEWPTHRVSRCDIATDLLGEGLYGRAELALLAVRDAQRALGRRLNDDRKGGDADRLLGQANSDPDVGLTYELGSGFPHKVRLYEKAKERYSKTGNPFWLDYPHLVRLELQVRPEKAGKSIAATMEPEAFWGCAEWLRQVKLGVLAMGAEPVQLKAPRVHDRHRAYRAMIQQYGPTMREFIEILGWETFALELARDLGVLGEESPQAA